MRQIVSAVIMMCALFVVGCSDFGVNIPDEATPFTPPEIYRQWWLDIEGCAQRYGDFNAIRWFKVPDSYLFSSAGYKSESIAAQTYFKSNVIIVRESYLLVAPIIRHEMLHILVPVKGHPRQYFRSECAKVLINNWPDDGTDN